MTTEIERTFFDTFEIKPKSVKRTLKLAMQGYDESDLPEDLKQFISSQAQVYNVYPQITDRILLELICIATASEITVEFKGIKNVEHLKEVVLNYCIKRYGYCLHKDKFKHQVCTLFEEE